MFTRHIGHISLALVLITNACAQPDQISILRDDNNPEVIDETPDGKVSIESAIEVNRYAFLGKDALSGETLITLSPQTPVTELKLQPHDLLLLIQSQGAAIVTTDSLSFGLVQSLEGAGRFELVGVREILAAQNQIRVYDWCGGLKNRYAADLTQIIRVPQYESLLIGSGRTALARPWDGTLGGVLAIRVAGELQLDGQLEVTGRGFRGGATSRFMLGRLPGFRDLYASFSPQDGAPKGESAAGGDSLYQMLGPFGRGAVANGGGGGNRILAGGGGGANGDSGQDWTGQGVMLAPTVAEQRAWSLDPGFVANGARLTTSSGGGRGGYSYSQTVQDPLTVGPGSAAWGGDLRRDGGGLGGRPVPNSPTERLFLGGGGGSGDNYDSPSNRGGNGGGLVLVIAEQISGGGQIKADGAAGSSSGNFSGGAGGGGGGGTIVLSADSVSPLLLSASGGAGGDQQRTDRESAGPGGGGGGGYIATPSQSSAVRLVGGGRSGTALSAAVQPFAANGATAGSPGRLLTLDPRPYGGMPFCSTADLSVQLTSDSPMTAERQPSAFTLKVDNRGPSPAADVVVTVQAPDTAEISLVDSATGWQCTTAGAVLDCRRGSMLALESSALKLSITPPFAVAAALVSAKVSTRSADPARANNLSEVSLDIANPLSPHGLGGGIACSVPRGAGRPTSALPLLVLFLISLLGRACARRRSDKTP